MKRVFLVLFLSILSLISACTEDPAEPETPQQPQEPEIVSPAISIKTVITDNSSITFEAKIENAEKAAYVLLQNDQEVPDGNTILKNGSSIPVPGNPATVKIENLKGATQYRIIAAAENKTGSAVSNLLKVETDKDPKVEIESEILETTFESVIFKVSQKNAERMNYMIIPAEASNPSIEEVLGKGEKIDLSATGSIEAGNLKDRTEYKLIVAATGYEQQVITQPENFKTKEDESKIIKQDYHLAKALVSKDNYYVQFYHEGNEDEILSLDFYAEGGNYLPAGNYEVKDIDSPTGIGLQFSKYGTSSIGTKLSSGTAEVTMDKPAGIYSFHVDLFLQDGQHLIADFQGEVENMPIRETIDFEAVHSLAERSDNGWNIQFSNSDESEKLQFSVTAENQNYIEEGKYVLPGENSGSYHNASGQSFPFQTGEIDIVID